MVSDFARGLGWAFGEVAVAVGEVELALAWARAIEPEAGRAAALGRVAAALLAIDERHAGLVVAEALGSTRYAGEVVSLLSDCALDRFVFTGTLARGTTADSLVAAAELAWVVARDGGYAPEDEARALASIRAAPGLDDELRLAIAAALWIIESRRGDADAAAAARRQVLDADRLATMPVYVQRAVITAAAYAGELPLVAGRLAFTMTRDLVAAYTRGGDVDAALAEAGGWPWIPVYLARMVPDDPRAAEWRERAQALGAELTERYADGLLTKFEEREARLELIALRAVDDSEEARSELIALVGTDVDRATASNAARREFVAGVAAGTRTLAVEANPKWFTPRGERALARALAQWCEPPDLRSRYSERREAAKIFDAAAAHGLRGDQPRALELMARGYAGEADAVSFIDEVQPPLIRALIVTDQVQRALELGFACALPPDALAPLVVELDASGYRDVALELLGPGFDRTAGSAGLFHLARGVLGVADDVVAAAGRMLAALAEADAELAAFARVAARA